MLIKSTRWESKKYRDYSKGEVCEVRVPGICNFDETTTVLAHMNGGGWSLKTSDFLGADCCSSCHAYVDNNADLQAKLYHYEGIFRTQQKRYDKKQWTLGVN